MVPSPAYVLGVLDVLVKSGEVSPDYAAGVADVLVKGAAVSSAWYNPWDTEAENLQQQWGGFMDANPGARDWQTGRIDITGDQVKGVIDKARPWYDNMWSRMGTNLSHGMRMAKYYANGGNTEGWLGKAMTPEESRNLREYDRNLDRQDFLNRTEGAGASAVYGAFQDQATQDARVAHRASQGYMSPAELEARFRGKGEDAAAGQFRTPEGTQAIRSGAYKPKFDKQSLPPPPTPPASASMPSVSMPRRSAPSINNNPLAHMYGSRDRNKLFTQSFRNGLGMY